MGSRTPLFLEHERLNARIVPFGGWDMPLHYGSQLDEHHAVRQQAGMFDVSHMRPVDIQGADALAYLQGLLANDAAKLKQPGKALYSCMLNADGGVIDDLICYYLGPNRYRAVVNAATADRDLAWMRECVQGASVSIDSRDDLAMLAIQGPQARAMAAPLLPSALREPALALKPFFATEQGDWLVGRTGYTGEDGFEIYFPDEHGPALWRALWPHNVKAGGRAIGLGARDTLRLEMKYALYGNDIDKTTNPLEAGLKWTVKLDKGDFIGREALLEVKRNKVSRKLICFEMLDRGIARHGAPCHDDDGAEIGAVTSGTMSPSLGKPIGLAYLKRGHTKSGREFHVEIRGKLRRAVVVKPPFYKEGSRK